MTEAAQETAHTTFKPWLAIPAEDYYRYNRFLLAPSLLMCCLLADSIVQLFSRFFRGSGTFEDTLAALGLGIAIPTWGYAASPSTLGVGSSTC